MIRVAFVILGACLVVATDREYMMTHGAETARVSDATRLPRWVKERRDEAIRVVNGGAALLAGCGLGLAAVVLRPRGRPRRSVAYGPGAIVAILIGAFILAFEIRWGIRMAIQPPDPFANRIIEALEKGGIPPWRMGWTAHINGRGLPANVASKRAYSGVSTPVP